MIAKVPLLHDGATAMAVGASNLALADLALQHRDGHLSASQLNYSGSLRADVIEIQDDGIPLPAVHAGGLPKAVEQEQKVAAAEWPRADRRAPRFIHSPRPDAPARATAVTVRAHELAVRDLRLDPFQSVGLSYKLADLPPLGTHMVEFEDGGVVRAAVSAHA
jgi:hypothetical protein